MSWAICECNYSFPRLWRNKFWNLLYLSNQAVFQSHSIFQSHDKNLNILITKRVFKVGLWPSINIIFNSFNEIYFLKNYAQNEAGELVPDFFLFFEKALCEVKASGLHLIVSIYFESPLLEQTIKINCIKLWTIDPAYFRFFQHILCMSFQEKCFSCHILLTAQISLFDCLCCLRCWATCAL